MSSMINWLDPFQLEILLEVIVAMVLGALLGLERELADKPAGLRTHMLVAAASTLFIALGSTLVNQFEAELGESVLRTDPIRIIEAVVTGISFLAAGTIIRRENLDVEGLTTAASILMAAAVGIAVALKMWILAIGVVLLALFTLRGFRVIERVVFGRTHRGS